MTNATARFDGGSTGHYQVGPLTGGEKTGETDRTSRVLEVEGRSSIEPGKVEHLPTGQLQDPRPKTQAGLGQTVGRLKTVVMGAMLAVAVGMMTVPAGAQTRTIQDAGPNDRVETVQSGQTISEIAWQKYGLRWGDIEAQMKALNPHIDDWHSYPAGTVVQFPSDGQVARAGDSGWAQIIESGSKVQDSTRFDEVNGEKIYGGQTVVGQGLSDAQKSRLLDQIPELDARGRPTKGGDVYDFMRSGITHRHVTPFSRIISGNAQVREIMPDLDAHEVGKYYVTGLGSDGIWAAIGLAPTSGGQGDRNGMTDLQAALMYAAIDDAQRFTVYHATDDQTASKYGDVDRYAFEQEGLVAGQRPAMDPGGEPRVVNPVPLLAKLKPGWNKIVYNPYPIPNPDHPCNAGSCTVQFDGKSYDIPQHTPHNYPVSSGGFPTGRIWLVYWDGK